MRNLPPPTPPPEGDCLTTSGSEWTVGRISVGPRQHSYSWFQVLSRLLIFFFSPRHVHVWEMRPLDSPRTQQRTPPPTVPLLLHSCVTAVTWSCCRGNVLTDPLPSNGHLIWIYNSEFEPWHNIFRGFLQFLQANRGTVPQQGYECFLRNTFQFINHSTIPRHIVSMLTAS
jgi:hypothetical protein